MRSTVILRRAVHAVFATLLPLASLLAPAPGRAVETSPAEVLGNAPLAFEANLGQSDPEVRYLARGAGYALFLTREEAVLSLMSGSPEPGGPAPRRDVLRMRPLGAAPAASLTPEEALPGRSHYARLSEPGKMLRDVPRYGRVRAREVYPGIDLVYYGNGRRLEYDFVVAPGADPNRIRLGFEGAESLKIDESGDLRLRLAGGDLVQPAPVLYQEIGGERRPVAGRFVLDGGAVAFQVGAYDPAQPLVIDPEVVWASYLGGEGTEWTLDVAVTPNGQAYACGYTNSTRFPTRPLQDDPDMAGTDAYVTKFNLYGTGIDWSVYLGGPGYQSANAIALDYNRTSYITGSTGELSLPDGPLDAWVAQVDAAGTLRWAQILRGSEHDGGAEIVIDASLNSYVVGTTHSANFPVRNAAQPTFGGNSDAFVAKLNRYGTVQWVSYYGGPHWDNGAAVTVDTSGRTVIGGYILTSDPYATDIYDAFVVRLTTAGTAFQGQLLLDGNRDDFVDGLAVDPSGNVWVSGSTESTNFPTTPDAIRRTLNGSESDAFLARLYANWSGFSYSTYIGSPDAQYVSDMTVDDVGRLYLAGSQIVAGGGPHHVWGARYIPSINSASTFTVAGDGAEIGSGIAIDNSRHIYVSGATTSSNLAKNGAFPNLRGTIDGFVMKIAF